MAGSQENEYAVSARLLTESRFRLLFFSQYLEHRCIRGMGETEPHRMEEMSFPIRGTAPAFGCNLYSMRRNAKCGASQPQTQRLVMFKCHRTYCHLRLCVSRASPTLHLRCEGPSVNQCKINVAVWGGKLLTGKNGCRFFSSFGC